MGFSDTVGSGGGEWDLGALTLNISMTSCTGNQRNSSEYLQEVIFKFNLFQH